MVEPRALDDLAEIVLDRHLKYLPDDWGFLLVGSDESIELLRTRISDLHAINISALPLSQPDYNRMLATPLFWAQLPFDKVLIFQHDSRLLRSGIEEFLEYDYVGAPWPFQQAGGNGGLSLRDRAVMLDVCLNEPYVHETEGGEDLFFSKHVPRYGRLAPREVCSTFSCETIFQLGTLGCHNVDRYLAPPEVQAIYLQYAVPRQAPDFRPERRNGEILLVGPRRGRSLRLNPTAATVFQLCDGSRDVSALTRLLEETYPEAGSSIREDVPELLRSLLDQQAITLAPA